MTRTNPQMFRVLQGETREAGQDQVIDKVYSDSPIQVQIHIIIHNILIIIDAQSNSPGNFIAYCLPPTLISSLDTEPEPNCQEVAIMAAINRRHCYASARIVAFIAVLLKLHVFCLGIRFNQKRSY